MLRRPAPTRHDVPVLVLQAGLRSGPWACRSLAEAGFLVIGGHDDGGQRTGRSRYCHDPLRYPLPARDAEGFIAFVEDLCRREGVAAVLPLSESVLHVLAERAPRPGGAALVGPTIDQYRRLCDKAALAGAAAEAGVAYPAEAVVDAAGPDGDYPPLPSIVKPRSSATPRGGRVVYRAAVVAATARERDVAVAALVEQTGGALVQEQVRGEGWRFDFVRHQVGMSALARRVIRSYPAETGMSSVSKVVTSVPPDLAAAAEGLLARAGYRGPGSMQFIEREGRFHLHDVNLRLPLSVGAVISGGLDIPRLAVEETLGRLPSAVPLRIRPTTYTWLAGELQGLAQGLRGQPAPTSPGRILGDLALAAISPRRVLDQLDPHDPGPTWELASGALRGRLRRHGGAWRPRSA